MIGRLVKAPFVWFLAVGALLFLADAYLNPGEGDDVVVDDQVVARIVSLWQQQMERPPSDYELRNLVDNWVDEEMLFREAKRLGLDKEDVIVKRRLIQKMHFLAEQAELTEPTEAALLAYFQAHQSRYALPRRFTFSHVFFRDQPGAKELAALANNEAWRTQGDASMLRPTYAQRSQREVAREFGEAFAEALAALAVVAGWQGPLKSEFGWHLVRMEAIAEAAMPTFDRVQRQVLNDFLFAAKQQARQNQLEALRRRYQVVIE